MRLYKQFRLEPCVVVSKPQPGQRAAESGSASLGGAVRSIAEEVRVVLADPLLMPDRICTISNKPPQVGGVFGASVVKSAVCCFALTYNIRTRGWVHTSKSHWTSMRCVRGRWGSDMGSAPSMICMTGALSSAMSRQVVCEAFLV